LATYIQRSRKHLAVFVVVVLAAVSGLTTAVVALAAPGSVHYRVAEGFAWPGFLVGPMVISPDGRTLYVTGTDSAGDNKPPYYWPYPKVVVPINAVSGASGKPIRIGGHGHPTALAITPDGKTLYVAIWPSGAVIPISTATGRPGKPVDAGRDPVHLAVSPDGKTLYVSSDLGTLTPIDTVTGRPGKPILLGEPPEELVVAPNGKNLYVGSALVTGDDSAIIPVSTATGRPGNPIAVSDNLTGLTIAPDGSALYATSMTPDGTGTVTSISTVTGTLGTPVLVGSQPLGIVIAPDGGNLYTSAAMISPPQVFTVTRVKLARSR